MNKDWIVGFIEGEGCFHKFKNRGKEYAIFSVCQNDKELLEKIKAFFGLGGHIYKMVTGDVWEFRITKQKDLMIIVNFLDNQIQSSIKKNQFEKWKKLVIVRNRDFGKREYKELNDN